MSEFKREERYVVIKIKDLVAASGDADPTTGRSEAECVLRNFLEGWHIPTRDCVVVEHDWPEYHLVWAMLEHRMAGKPVPNFNDWRRADELQQLLTAADQQIDDLRAELKAVRLGPCKMIVGDELP